MSKLIEAIRRAIDESDLSRYRISRETGVAESQLSRLMSGKQGLDVGTVEKLAEFLGLEIVIRAKRGRKGK